MKENINLPLSHTEEVPKPALLDIVKIDGVWAQVCQMNMVRFLDDGRYERINWDDYNLVRNYMDKLMHFVQYFKETGEISQDQINKMYWGSEQKELGDAIKEQITVFGEFEKKKRGQTHRKLEKNDVK